MPQHVRQRVGLVHMRGLGQQVHDDFGVGRALEDVAVLFVLVAKELCVDQISVVRHGDRADRIFAQERLGVAELARAGGGIADVADGRVAGELFARACAA